MDPSALAGLCALLARGAASQPLPAGVTCPPSAIATAPARPTFIRPASQSRLTQALSDPSAREGIARVAYAEAANQGDSGLAGVVYTILNRIEDGRWGATVDAVLNARGQFEPVMRAGGSWRNLRPVSDAQRARIDTILNLALDGRLPDLTNGARFFQNANVVAAREAAGTVSPGLTNFGGAATSARIGDHSFYAEAGRAGGAPRGLAKSANDASPPTVIFVGENRAAERSGLVPDSSSDPFAPQPLAVATQPPAAAPDAGPSVDPLRGIFVLRDGRGNDRAR